MRGPWTWLLALALWTGCPGEDDDAGDDDGADDDAGDDDAGDDDGADDDAGDDDGGDDDTHPPADVEGTLWAPTLQWTLDNPGWEGNPFDLVATVTFTHDDSGATHATEMFYAGGDSWAFRFTGTAEGMWHWTSACGDPDLDGHTGSIWIEPNPGVNGFVDHDGEQWVWTGTDRAFVPQLAMFAGPHYHYGDWDAYDDELQRLLVDHGFNGLHVPVLCRWADLDHAACDEVADPNPDGRTFEALEILIERVHAAGGMVHLWMWGDQQRQMTPQEWDGLNGSDDLRIQRYLAARLGPLPGWTLGYGFDLDEWTTEADLATWHATMHDLLGWPHLLGGRSAGPNSGTDHSDQQIYEGLDYSGYEHHRPDYDVYVAAIDARPGKPTFSEDRFRVRDTHPDKDYTEEMTRRGLYHSTMAGGVANIWGYLLDDGVGGDFDEGLTHSYPHAEWIRTNATFFQDRFAADLERCSELTDGVCLRDPGHARHLLYVEDAAGLAVDLSAMAGDQPAVAVDTTQPYAEVSLGTLSPGAQTLTFPSASDWVVAIGSF